MNNKTIIKQDYNSIKKIIICREILIAMEFLRIPSEKFTDLKEFLEV
jgi:hypothetical protein